MPSSRTAKAARFLRSNLLGLVAIFIVLGGTAVALPGKNRIDSGDIKQGQVRTLDLHRSAVTKSKLRRNAVDGTRVRRDSLTGEDVDESTLELPVPALKAGSVGEREETDRERRIVIGAGELAPSIPGSPDVGLQFGYPAVFYPSAEDRSTGAVFEVPLDRASESGLQARLLWDSQSTGAVIWRVSARQVGVGADLSSGVQGGSAVTATATDPTTPIETVALDIPAAALANGEPVALNIARDADAPADTLPGDAYLRLVEIRYTATG